MVRAYINPDNHKPGTENKDVLKQLHQEFFSILKPRGWVINQYEASINALRAEGSRTEELKLYYMFGHKLVIDISSRIKTTSGQRVKSRRVTVSDSATLADTLLKALSESPIHLKGCDNGDPQRQPQ